MHLSSILVLAAAFMPFAATDDCVQRTTPCVSEHDLSKIYRVLTAHTSLQLQFVTVCLASTFVVQRKTLANARQWLFLTTILDLFR